MTTTTVSPTLARPVPGPLAVRLRDRRTELGLSQRQAANSVEGLTHSRLSRIEAGHAILANGPVLASLAALYGMDAADAATLAGGLSRDGERELLGSDIRLALDGGRLSEDSRAALRVQHLRRIAAQYGGAKVETVADDLRLTFRRARDTAGFEGAETYRLPDEGEDEPVQRAWMAHGVAHVLLAAAGEAACRCEPRGRGKAEVDATTVARYVLLPSATVHSAFRRLRAPAPSDPSALASFLSSLVRDLAAPADWIAARLSEEGLLGVFS